MAVRFACPECGQKLHISSEFSGRLVACPTCNARLRVPEPEPEDEDQAPATEGASDEETDSAGASQFPWPREDEDEQGASLPDENHLPDEADILAGPATGVATSPGGVPPEQPEALDVDQRTGQETPASRPTRELPAERQRVAATAERPPDPSLTKGHFEVDHEELIDMTAMVDIVFFLLIFFLVTSMQALDSTIAMPNPDPAQGAGAAAASEPSNVEEFDADEDYIVVRIDKNDAIDVEGVVLHGQADLLLKLRELRDAAPHPNKLLVVGDGEAHHATMVMVLDTGHDAGMERVRMAIGGAVDEE